MPQKVNLDALIPREDFEVTSDGDEVNTVQSIQIRDLEKGVFFYAALRKPDFQRETAEWDPARVVRLVETFIKGELIPAVILWKHNDLVFVIDGSHRLGALIAWVQDDYGDGEKSQSFFNHVIPEEQKRAAEATRLLVEKTIGSYRDHKLAIEDPEKASPELVARARRLGSLALQLQWVRGDAEKAEDSFIRINQQAAIITPEEMELLKSRRQPRTIAARAVIRRGTGHKYWSPFSKEVQNQIVTLATEVHELLFQPQLSYPIKAVDLPIGGTDYSSTALKMVYDLITFAVATPSSDPDLDGTKTIQYLRALKRVVELIASNAPCSLGLHPAIYFYSWTGKHQPILLLVWAELVLDLERHSKLPMFIHCRSAFEEFLIENRTLVNQVVRKYGTKDSGRRHLLEFYRRVLAGIESGLSKEDLIGHIMADGEFSYLQPEEQPYSSIGTGKFSTAVKSGVVLRELLHSAPTCAICSGLVPAQAISIDHIVRVTAGGASNADNGQVTHPYCNTGIKH